ncbi:MAG: hypothetical protein AAF078_07975 [Planctomycetota bacterium]
MTEKKDPLQTGPPGEPLDGEELSVAEVRLQDAIDDALKRRFGDGEVPRVSLPTATSGGAGGAGGDGGAAKRSGVLARIGVARVVAAAAILVLSGWVGFEYVVEPWLNAPPTLMAQAQGVHERMVDNGFVPGWTCETIGEFETAFADRLGQAVTLDAFEWDGVRLVGLSYVRIDRQYSIAVLAEVDGEPVVVVAVKPNERVGRQEGVFTKQIGDVLLIEVTPFEEPRVLPELRALEPVSLGVGGGSCAG